MGVRGSLNDHTNDCGKPIRQRSGGVFSNDVTAEGIRLMQNLGACGTGQSSWGPTFYGLFDSLKKAEETKRAVQSFLIEKGVGGEVFIADANNRGAYIRIYRGQLRR